MKNRTILLNVSTASVRDSDPTAHMGGSRSSSEEAIFLFGKCDFLGVGDFERRFSGYESRFTILLLCYCVLAGCGVLNLRGCLVAD